MDSVTIFNSLVKTDSDGDAMTSGGRLFHTQVASTPKARSSMVTRRVCGNVQSVPALRHSEVAVESLCQTDGAVTCKVWQSQTMQATEDDGVVHVAWWLSGRALDLRFTGRGFNSWPVAFT